MTDECFPAHPTLPSGTVSRVMVSLRKPSVVRALQACGVGILSGGTLHGIGGEERLHADMAVCTVGGGVLWTACNLSDDGKERLRREGFCLHETAQPVTAACPSLNVAVIGDTVLYCPVSAEAALCTLLQQQGRRLLPVRQRYARCSSAVVSADALITADASIEKTCRRHHIDVLKITEGFIALDGYGYGFIGGCCGLLSRDTLAFSGCVERHPDYDRMKAFARQYGVQLLSLTPEPLYDIGGILPMKEWRHTL